MRLDRGCLSLLPLSHSWQWFRFPFYRTEMSPKPPKELLRVDLLYTNNMGTAL